MFGLNIVYMFQIQVKPFCILNQTEQKTNMNILQNTHRVFILSFTLYKTE